MRANKAILVLGGVLATAVVMAGCTFAVAAVLLGSTAPLSDIDMAEFDTVDDWPGAPSFAERFALDLPPSTRDITVASSGFQEPVYHLRFTIDLADRAVIVDSIGCDGLLSQPASDPPTALIDDLDWWQADAAEVYQECQGGQFPGRVQNVFIDDSHADRTDVYVRVIYL